MLEMLITLARDGSHAAFDMKGQWHPCLVKSISFGLKGISFPHIWPIMGSEYDLHDNVPVS